MRRARAVSLILGLMLLFMPVMGLAQPDPGGTQPTATGSTVAGDSAAPKASGELHPAPGMDGTPKPMEGLESSEGDGSQGEEKEVTWGRLIGELGKVISDFRTVGILAGFIALINLLLLILRFKPIDAWLEKKNLKKWKPLVGGILGGVLVTLVSLGKGVPLVDSLIAGAAGVLTALASTGVHNLFTAGNEK
jgi:hypothetical protein